MKTFVLSLLVLLGYNTTAQTIAIQSFATGLTGVVEITHCGDSRLFAVQQNGQIKIVNANGTVNATPFLNISTLITSGGERGLLGLAFHPNYATNGQFFVNYTNTSGNTVIARYTVSANPNVANTTGTILMTINQPYSNHNGGSLKFGPDGYLYIGMGDGGSGGDPQGYAQNLDLNNAALTGNPSRIYLGKMLRIDVNTIAGLLNYGFPPTNPYVTEAGKEEIWARGLRNPWKFSFNRLTGDLWIADVGQGSVEEINKITAPLPNGLNFGWKCFEGNTTYSTCTGTSSMTMPFTQYTHAATGGCSITGGYVYTGSLYPNFLNKYFFADYCLNRIGYANVNTGTITYTPYFSGSNYFTSFGEDVNGELYITSGTIIFKIVDTSLANQTFESANMYLSPNPANQEVTLYNPNSILLTELNVYDLTGKIVLTQKIQGNGNTTFSCQSLSKGLYVISASADGKAYNGKLIVN